MEKAPISIIEDDESMREALSSLIRSVGYNVETFASTEEACLILDIQLPGMGGLELQWQLSVATYRFPIIFITGQIDGAAREQALKAGAIDFLYKPLNQEALLDAIGAALRL